MTSPMATPGLRDPDHIAQDELEHTRSAVREVGVDLSEEGAMSSRVRMMNERPMLALTILGVALAVFAAWATARRYRTRSQSAVA